MRRLRESANSCVVEVENMTDSNASDGAENGEWNPRTFAADLAEDPTGRVARLAGVVPSAFQEDLTALRRAAENEGMLAFAFDPTGAFGDRTTVRELVTAYARDVERRGDLGARAEELIGCLGATREAVSTPCDQATDGRDFRTAVCRLWKALSRQVPAVVAVFHPEEASSTDRAVLEDLVEGFFVDPVSDLVPELEDGDGVQGAILFVGDGETGLDVDEERLERIDVSSRARSTVEDFLERDAVVEQIVESTGGDPRRLEALLDTLPDDGTNFWAHRYGRLDDRPRTLVELVAVATEPLTIETLERAARSLGVGDDVAGVLRELCDAGFLSRSIDTGTVAFQLQDRSWCEGLHDEIGGERHRRLHRTLAEALEATRGGRASDRALAHHYLEAGCHDQGLEYGMRAARRLHGEHALSEAREMYGELLDHADSDEHLREIRTFLVDIELGLGDPSAALAHVEALEELTEEGRELARVQCRKGRISHRRGEYERARDLLEDVSDRFDPDESAESRRVWASARFERAATAYAAGDHGEAESRASELIERLVGDDDDDGGTGTGDRELDRLLVRARNLLGRLAIYRTDREAARPLFEKNLALASDWRWDHEVDRAEANLALIALQEGDYESAQSTLEDVRSRHSGSGVLPRQNVLLNLGMCLHKRGDLAAAFEHYRDALRASKRAEDDVVYGIAAYNMATVLQDFGAYDRTIDVLEHLSGRQSVYRQNVFIGPLPEVLRANALFEQREYAEAIRLFEDVCDGTGTAGSEGPMSKARLRAALAHLELDQCGPAEEALEAFDTVDAERSAEVGGLRTTVEADIAAKDDDHDRAARLAADASDELAESGAFQDAVRASLIRAEALDELGRTAEARAALERRVEELRQRAGRVPETYRDDFRAIAAHRDLVERCRELGGEVPSTLELDEQDADATDDRDVPRERDLAFRRWRSRYAEIVGDDDRLLDVFRRIDQVADSDSPILIEGESGTGKELIAEAIHSHGRGGDEVPFVKVNCGAFVDNLLLSELFGHEKGAFTGAVEEKVGRFERADGGTIFLDEIGEISAKAQVALLRVLQEGEFERVGGTETRSVDVRVVCATNRDLEEMVDEGDFRLDLYYRLKGVLLELPPLRDRRQDIPRLVRHFAGEFGDDDIAFDEDVLEFLASYSWPGNIRELKNFVRSILLFTDEHRVEMSHLREFDDFFSEGEFDGEPPEIEYEVAAEDFEFEEALDREAVSDPDEEVAADSADPEEALVEAIVSDQRDLSELKDRIEHESIRRALIETEGNITRAAEILQMTRPRLSQIVNGDDELVALKERLVS